MSNAARFDRSGLAGALIEAARSGGFVRLRLEGAEPLAGEVMLRVAGGRVLEVLEPSLPLSKALLFAALARGGTLERWPEPDPPAHILKQGVPVAVALSRADRGARRIRDLLEPLGGFGAVPRSHHGRLMDAPPLPEPAARVLRQIDGERTVAAVLAGAPVEPELAARILERLALEGLISFDARGLEPRSDLNAAAADPAPFEEASPARAPDFALPEARLFPPAVPGAEEVGGPGVEAVLQSWLATHQVPKSLLSDEAFSSAYAADVVEAVEAMEAVEGSAPRRYGGGASRVAPRFTMAEARGREPPAGGSPPAPTPDERSEEGLEPPAGPRSGLGIGGERKAPGAAREDEAALFAEAGLSRWPSPWLTSSAAAVALAIAAFLLWPRGGSEEVSPVIDPPPDPALAIAETASRAVAVRPPPVEVEVEVEVEVAVEDEDEVEPAPAPPLARRVSRASAPPVPARGRSGSRGRVDPVEQAAALLDAGDPEAAETILSGLRRSRPSDARVLRLSAKAAVDLGDHDAALRFADRALARAPKAIEAWWVKGSALQFAGREAEAIRAYERGLRLDPDHPRAEEVRRVVEALRSRSMGPRETSPEVGGAEGVQEIERRRSAGR